MERTKILLKYEKNGDGKYEVDDGRHRFVFLKLLYLSELKKCNGEADKIKELNEKFTIPAIIRNPIDYELTYCNYILHKIPTIDFETGKKMEGISIKDLGVRFGGIYVEYSNGKNIDKIPKETIVHYAKEGLKDNKNVNLNIVKEYSKDEGFRNYIDENIPEISHNLQLQKGNLEKIDGIIFGYDLHQNIWQKMDKLQLVNKRNVLYSNLLNKTVEIRKKIQSGKMSQQEFLEISSFIGNNKAKIIEASDDEFERIYEEGIKEKVNLLIKQNKLNRIKKQQESLLPNEKQSPILKLRKCHIK